MRPDNQNILEKPNVTIGFSVNGANPRIFRVSVSRLSCVVTLILGLMTWGAIATVLLFYRTWSADSGTPPVAAISGETPMVTPPLETSKALEAVPEWKMITVKNDKGQFFFDESFAVSQIKIRRTGIESFALSFHLNNTEGELREGNIWALARFTDGEGHTVDLLSSQAAGIQKDGTALDSSQGSRFAIRNHKARELKMNGAVSRGMRLEKLAIGLHFLADSDQDVLEFKDFTVE